MSCCVVLSGPNTHRAAQKTLCRVNAKVVLCCACQGLTRTELYVELLRSGLMLAVDVVERSSEMKVAGFMFLKVSR